MNPLKVGAVRYRVNYVCRAAMSDEGRRGTINHEMAVIELAEGRPPDATAETLTHEILHALFHDIDLDWEHEDEEKMVQRLSPRLAAFLADNPDQVRELITMLEE